MSDLYGPDLAHIQAAGFTTAGAAPEILHRFRAAATPVRHVLDLGCGAGALTRSLADAGFDVTAVDSSPDLLALTRDAAPAARFVQSSIYDFELPRCDAILALGEPLTYHDEIADADRFVRDFFHRAAAVLPPGGLLIFDLIETGEPPLASRSWTSGDDWAVLVDTREDTAARALTRTIETFRAVGALYRRAREVHRVRLFDTAEVVRWLGEAGFSVETAQSYGAHRLLPRRRAFFCACA